jgi:hypothetical protein
MAHAVFAMYATQGTHQEFAERVGAMEFEIEGPLRKGKVRPVLSEWKLYDVRLPKAAMQEFINRAGVTCIDKTYKNPEQDGQGLWILRWVFWAVRKFTPLKAMYRTDDSVHDMLHNSWAYRFQVGVIDDPQQKVYTNDKKTREVL